MKQKEFLKELSKRTGITVYQFKKMKISEHIFDIISEQLKQGNEIRLFSLGKVSLKQFKEKRGHNPHTHTPMIIPSYSKIIFKFTSKLKNLIK